MKNKKKKGFTMVEVLIAIVILAVLTAVVIPMVSKYVTEGKDKYNEKLKTQLLLSGKEYYSNNKSKLPTRDYRGLYKQKSYSTVSLPEIQTNNLISKDFVDSEVRSCSPSYVYVKRDNENEENYEWHACLICEGKGTTINYSKEDPVCQGKDWDDTINPTCSNPSYSGDTKYNHKVFNPKKLFINSINDYYNSMGKPGKIAAIEVKNQTTKKKYYIKTNKKTFEEIQRINIIKTKSLENGTYNVTIIDTGNHYSKPCASFIIDNDKPSCTLSLTRLPNNKTLTLTPKDNYSKNKDIRKVIDNNEKMYGAPNFPKERTGTDTVTKDITWTKDATYYGHVMDEASNEGICKKEVKIEMDDDDTPYCIIDEDNKNLWYSAIGTNKQRTIAVECYVKDGIKASVDKTKITTNKNLGTISNITRNDQENQNQNNKVIYNITYKPKNGSYGTDNIIINEGFVKTTKSTNKKVTSNNIRVDSIAPTITYTPSGTKGGSDWYKAPLSLTISCSDKGGSKVSSLLVNGKTTRSFKITSAARNAKYSSVCKDNAGNTSSTSKAYNVQEYSPHSSCSCKEIKYCTNGCKQYYYNTGYKYYWTSGGYQIGTGCCIGKTMVSSCNASTVGGYKKVSSKCVDWNKRGSKKVCSKYRYTLNKCARTTYTYRGSCKQYYYKSCGCKQRYSCWHY